MATQYDPIAKDESLNTTENPSRNIADVLAEELARIVTALGGGSLEDLNDVAIVMPSNGQTLKYNSTTQKWENANDAGGHTIIDSDDQSMPQRAGLGFTDAHVSDNSGDDRTDVEIMEATTEQAFDALTPSGNEADGMYLFQSSNAMPLTADMVGYGNGTVKSYLDGLVKSIDITVPSSGNVMSLTLPTGFTTSNCIPLNVRRNGSEDCFVQNADTTVYFDGANAMFYYASNMYGRSMTIYFMRIA